MKKPLNIYRAMLVIHGRDAGFEESKHPRANNGQFGSGGGGGGSKEGHPHSHMHALQDRLFREKQRMNNAKTNKDREFRKVQVAQVEKEIAQEKKFLEKKGTPYKQDEDVSNMSDEDILNELLK